MSAPFLAIADLPSVAGRLRENGSGRPRIDRVQGRDQLYRLLVQLAIRKRAGCNYFRTSWGQLAGGLGYDVTGDTARDGARYQGTIRRRADDLADAGLIDYRPATIRGRFVCLEVRVLPGTLEDEQTGAEVDIRRTGERAGQRWGGTFCRTGPGRKRPPVCRPAGGRQRPVERPISFSPARSAKTPSGSKPPRPLRGQGSACGLHGPPRRRGPTSAGGRSSPRNRAVGPAEGHGTPTNGQAPGGGGLERYRQALAAGASSEEAMAAAWGDFGSPSRVADLERSDQLEEELADADREWSEQLERREARKRDGGRPRRRDRKPGPGGRRPHTPAAPPGPYPEERDPT